MKPHHPQPTRLNNPNESTAMKLKSLRHITAKSLSLLALSLVLAGSPSANAGEGNAGNPRILPPHSRAFGLSYAEWSAKWWQWASGIPFAQNPLFDTTGEFADQEQSGHVWFLAGAFGGTVERTATVPVGKALFFPIFNALWWAPDDLPFAREVAETYLGKTPAEIALLSDVELIGLLSDFNVGPDPVLSVEIDGVAVANLAAYHKISPGFRIVDRDLIDDLGLALDVNNTAVSAGYWIMLAPLRPGKHTIHFHAELVDHPTQGDFGLDVTYHLTVAPRK